MTRALRMTALALAAIGVAAAADSREEAVGLVLTATGGKVLRANSETPLAARAGDILFSGDALKSDGGPANFLYCPAKTSQTLDPGGEVLLDAKNLKVKTGKISGSKPVNACFLPQVVRVAVASQQHYGVSMTRGLTKPDGDVIAFDQLPQNVKDQIAPLEAALKADPNDTSALVEEAAAFERAKLDANALAAYRKVSNQWKDAVWVRGRIFDLEESIATQAALKAAEISPDANTYVLAVGISKYEKLPKDQWPKFTQADAKSFEQHMLSARGGSVPGDRMVVLTDEQATTAALRNGFQSLLRNRAGKKDTIIILLSAHGIADSRGSYIMSYDSDPQDLSTTAIPISEIQSLVEDELSKVGRVILFADLVRSTQLGNLKTAAVGSAVEKLGQAPGEMLGLMASRPKEVGLEGTEFGGGHGAFSWSVIQGLEGQADKNNNRSVEAGELIDYVRDDVAAKTGNKQHPRDFGNLDNATKLADFSKAGMNITRFPAVQDPKNGGAMLLAQAGGAQLSTQAQQDVTAFQQAVRDKKVRPNEPGSAWDYLTKLRQELPAQQAFQQENLLRIALEDQAQQVLLRYLAGDQNPQTRAEFDEGSQFMELAMRLTPESLYLQGRNDFFSGRSLLFDKKYAEAADLLEQSVRIDPGQAYGYNALGIAYLEQAQFEKAIPAFRDASKRAPNWSYPLHNLALSYVESGDTENAIRAYQQAIRITPQYSYLPYNLGLVYQRTNRKREAEAAYRKAISLSPEAAEPLNALGTLKASEGKTAEAEKLYKDALAKNPNLLPARHNLALLLSGEKGREDEAVEAFKKNIASSGDYLPSRLSLAEMLAKRGDSAGAIEQYSAIVQARPEYFGARLALATELTKAHRAGDALDQLHAASRLDDQNAALWEQIGDSEKALQHPNEAKDAYAKAMKLQEAKADRNRLRAKMNF